MIPDKGDSTWAVTKTEESYMRLRTTCNAKFQRCNMLLCVCIGGHRQRECLDRQTNYVTVNQWCQFYFICSWDAQRVPSKQLRRSKFNSITSIIFLSFLLSSLSTLSSPLLPFLFLSFMVVQGTEMMALHMLVEGSTPGLHSQAITSILMAA